MSSAVVMGRGTWLDKVAVKIIEREKMLGRSLDLVRVESGLGASGIPHVGSLGDAVRSYGVKMALQDMGYQSELIAFSDDLDGLRKVPAGLPTWLGKYLATPVSMVPDPFDCHASYASHMSAILTEALDKLGIEYSLKSGTEVYRAGLLNEQIAKVLENAQTIGENISKMLGQKKYEDVLPYFPICEQCGRIYLAEAYQYVQDERKVLYRCRGAEIRGRRLEGCGHQGEMKIRQGRGKLSWKVEFAARWAALGIRFEAYGKDIADSVRVNDWVAQEILRCPPPYHVRYEMFLDRSGRKISKSAGNVFTPQTWLRYGSPQSLLLLMFKRIKGTRTLSITDIPKYMDEYDRLEDTYFGKIKMENRAKLAGLKGLYEYVNHLTPPQQPPIHVPHRLMTQLVEVAPKEAPEEFVLKRLQSYNVVNRLTPELIARVKLAVNWTKDAQPFQKAEVQLSTFEKEAVRELASLLSRETDPKKIQSDIFEIAKKHGVSPPDFFQTLYRILLSSDRGPRLGPYLVDVGRENAAKLLVQQLEE